MGGGGKTREGVYMNPQPYQVIENNIKLKKVVSQAGIEPKTFRLLG